MVYLCIGSQNSLDCGVDGYPSMIILDPQPNTYNNVNNLCMTVHGAKRVVILYPTQAGTPDFHVEVKCFYGFKLLMISNEIDDSILTLCKYL